MASTVQASFCACRRGRSASYATIGRAVSNQSYPYRRPLPLRYLIQLTLACSRLCDFRSRSPRARASSSPSLRRRRPRSRRRRTTKPNEAHPCPVRGAEILDQTRGRCPWRWLDGTRTFFVLSSARPTLLLLSLDGRVRAMSGRGEGMGVWVWYCAVSIVRNVGAFSLGGERRVF